MKLKDIKKDLVTAWNWLPKEARKSIKVSLYITVSFFIGEGINVLSGMSFDSMLLTFLVNIMLVFLKELKSRVDVKKNRKEK
jgi:hypothetical protein